MPLPRPTDAQIAWIVQSVAEYIEQRRQTYRQEGVRLDPDQTAAMHHFFSTAILDSTRVVILSRGRVGNPLFYAHLMKMGFDPGTLPDFALMAAITFVDTVVSHEPFTETLLFHELVHVVQYEKLGLHEFAARYVRGFLSGGCYEAIPLEVNAYELQERFAAAPARPFSVANEVQAWIEAGRF